MSDYPVPRVLVVDDFKPMGRIYCGLFKQIGLEPPDVALDAATAFFMMLARPYAVVISDWHMPDQTGLELLTKVRAEPMLFDTPFIMATVESDEDSLRAAYEAGATDYLIKPFKAGALRAALISASPQIAAAIERSVGTGHTPVVPAPYLSLFHAYHA